MKELKVEKRKRGWALVVSASGRTQERRFHYKADAERARENFSYYSEFQLEGIFDHYFSPIAD